MKHTEKTKRTSPDPRPLTPDPHQGYIHSLETAGTVDGPGIRFVVFLSGCPLRCLYCHNPDTRNLKDGQLMSVEAITADIARYSDFMKRTGGGVTLTGGEPLFQQDFTIALLQACKALGLHTALDTSGFLGRKVKQEVLDATDLVLLDIKAFDETVHKKVTGKPLAPTLAFAELLAEQKKPVWVRCVIVPGLTDNLDHLRGLAAYLAKLGNVEKVEVLPFHKMGEAKWKSLGLPYALSDTPPASPELIRTIHGIFAAAGLAVV